MDPKLITPVLFTLLLIWAIRRRVRRAFGRQPVRVGRMWIRIGVLAAAGGLVFAGSWRDMSLLEALAAGFACGAALAWLGLRHTRFEITPQGRFYIPHTYIGLVVTALFLTRLAYRLYGSYYTAQAAAYANPDLFAASQRSPLTVAIVGVLLSYYLLFNLGVLRNSRALAAPAERVGALDVQASPSRTAEP